VPPSRETPGMSEPYALAAQAAEAVVATGGGLRPEVAVVLGSGWGDALDLLGDTVAELSSTELPGFPAPTVPGHGGRVRIVRAGERVVLAFAGRVHLYEGHPPATVVHGVRVAAAAGCRTVFLTNAAGSLDPAVGPGRAVLLSDQLNLTGATPMGGPPPPAPHPLRFVDLTDAYAPRLRAIARAVDPTLTEGVYAGLLGGAYETPAEIRMLRTLGADLVGMSTVLECIAARHLGLEVLGVSLVTNLAAGLSAAALDHEDVVAVGDAAGEAVGRLLRGVLDRL
jgi:purine-nucleoside phosphorylase